MTPSNERSPRQQWMSVLAQATVLELEQVWQDLAPPPRYQWLRQPESGLTLIRARVGNTGSLFNVGEMTLTRASVVVNEVVGHAYLKGSNKRQAELAALFDALLQQDAYQAYLMEYLIQPIQQRLQAEREQRQADIAATKVDFYTLVRGESA